MEEELEIKSIYLEEQPEVNEVILPPPILSVVTICAEKDRDRLAEYLKWFPKRTDLELIIVHTEVGERETTSIDQQELRFITATYKHIEGKFCFSSARNYAKSLARGIWILSLDMDEIIPPYEVEDLFALLYEYQDKKEVKGFRIGNFSSQSNFINNKYNRIGSESVRIFRNLETTYWQGHLHELVEWTLLEHEIKNISFALWHTGYDMNLNDMIRKFERNIRGLSWEVWENKDDDQWQFYLDYLKRTLDEYTRLKNEM